MKTRRVLFPILVLAAFLAATGCAAFRKAEPVQLPQWEPRDFAFRGATPHANPFLVAFSAVVRGPDGAEFKTPGFYDGDGTWKVRVSANKGGEWTLRTECEDPALDGRRASFTCVKNPHPNQHGGLRVDPRHPYHFVFEDGARYFAMGYECDWLWALDLGPAGGDPNLPTLKPFLDKLGAYGFNFIILNTYAHDTSWMPGKTGPDDYGPPAMFAWEGANEKPDHERFNLEFWRHYDRVIRAMHERNMQAHILVKVFNKMVKWPAWGSPQDLLYTRWIYARYSAFPNVIFDFSKEAYYRKNERDYKLEHLKFMRSLDGYGRLLTVHDDKEPYNSGAYDGLLSFVTDQQHSSYHDTVLKQRARHAWPIVNAEFGYECGPGGVEDKTYGADLPEENYLRAWEVCMAGGYIAYYYTYTAWDVVRPLDTPPGYAMHKHLRDFFEGTGYWRMKPADALVNEGYCLANPGKEYVAYQKAAKPFTLEVKGASGPLKVRWYSPLSGESADGGTVGNGPASLTPPKAWENAPLAVHVGSLSSE
jgi:hypothetical protein